MAANILCHSHKGANMFDALVYLLFYSKNTISSFNARGILCNKIITNYSFLSSSQRLLSFPFFDIFIVDVTNMKTNTPMCNFKWVRSSK